MSFFMIQYAVTSYLNLMGKSPGGSLLQDHIRYSAAKQGKRNEPKCPTTGYVNFSKALQQRCTNLN